MNANIEEFSRMKNDQLGSFLRERGIPHHDRKKKDRVTLAKAASNMGILRRPKPEEIKADVETDKENLLTMENGIIKLPCPDKLTAGWGQMLSNLPSISSKEVIDYIDKRKFNLLTVVQFNDNYLPSMALKNNLDRHELMFNTQYFFYSQGLDHFSVDVDAGRTKALKDGENLLISGHVRNLEMHTISPNIKYCFVKAIVNPAMSRTQEPYRVWVVLYKEIASIQAGYCVCTAG